MFNLLISEPPLQVLPSLAVKVGLNEAIILQQMHYWLQRTKNEADGYKWVYNSYDAWNEQFPFWSNSTLRRAIKSLENQGLLISGNYNKAGFDKTKWYRIDYKRLNDACGQNDQTNESNCTPPSGQGEQTNESNCATGVGHDDSTNTNRLPESTTETTRNDDDDEGQPDNWELIIKDWTDLWDAPNIVAQKALNNWLKTFSPEMIRFAINVAGYYNVKSFGAVKYIQKVIDGWQLRKITTLKQAEQAAVDHDKKSGQSGTHHKSKPRKELIPQWAQGLESGKNSSTKSQNQLTKKQRQELADRVAHLDDEKEKEAV